LLSSDLGSQKPGKAGRYRTVRTAKEGNAFCYPEYIAQNMEALFARLGTGVFAKEGPADAFIVAAAHFLAELNAIHPFREGNGRTQLSFLFLVADRAGHQLALELIEKDRFLPAMVASFHGNLGPLETELTTMLRR